MKTNSISINHAIYISKLHGLPLLKVKSRHNAMYHPVNQINMYILGQKFISEAYQV
jgi:hypothetical protein